MNTYRYIDDFTPGDTYKLTRILKNTPLSDAWFTVKGSPTMNDSAADLQIHITTTTSPIGVIATTPEGITQIQFIVAPASSMNMDSVSTYYYDVKVKTVGGDLYTLEGGKLFTSANITQAH